mmetsp:Transcript_35048/g.41834  ORF Transcript_35048/g.41834 Transcript_35048/m.41834 type:complete len:220 (+) Transcript_35048:60-719(+)
MSCKRIILHILSICCYLRASCVSGSNARAYLFYENAKCTDDTNIEGIYTYAFDDESYSDYGYSDYYTGDCLYLAGGYWEVDMSYDSNAYESIQYGSCVECNGQVGCSSDGTCDNFMNFVPQTSYQMTQDDDVSGAAITEGEFATAYQMQQSTIEAFESSKTSSSTARYVMIGASVGCVAIVGFFASLEGLRQIRQAKRSQVNVNTIPLYNDEVQQGIIV